jgi:homoserine O-acetyltransferase
MVHALNSVDISLLDDDPSVAAHGVDDGIGALIGSRRSLTLPDGLTLESGAYLSSVEVAYETWGCLNSEGDNAILVCHALTGDSHASGKYTPDDTRLGWWDPLIGPGRAFDTRRFFVVCINVLGGCQGTTGPASINQATGRPYGSTFPQVTVRDMVRVQYKLLRKIGVSRLAAVAGGSLGGMQALEWMISYPDYVAAAIPIGTAFAHTAQGIAFNLVGREAIALDRDWQGGDYYGTGRVPARGLSIARMVGMITYQSEESMRRKFDRERVDLSPGAYYDPASCFQVENYLYYQGQALVSRFDANSYLTLTRAMDLHDIGYNRGGIDAALRHIPQTTRTLVIGIDSDILFPKHHQREIVDRLTALNHHATYYEISSPWGHDAFLIEYGQLTAAITKFLDV